MGHKPIRATELAEFVYCSRAWELKDLRGVEPSREAQQLQSNKRPDGPGSRTEAAFPLRVLVFFFKRKYRVTSLGRLERSSCRLSWISLKPSQSYLKALLLQGPTSFAGLNTIMLRGYRTSF